MANHPSAEKRNRQRIKRTDRNRGVRSEVRTVVKNARTAFQAGDKTAAKATLLLAISALDRASTKGVLHRKTSARRIARLTKAFTKLG